MSVLIFGENDAVTQFDLIKNDVEKNNIQYHIIKSAGHKIVETHQKEVLEFIFL